MKKVLVSLAVIVALNANGKIHIMVGKNDSVNTKKGDTIVVIQPFYEMNFTILPYVTTTILDGRVTLVDTSSIYGEKVRVWEFIVERDMKIVKHEGQPIDYSY